VEEEEEEEEKEAGWIEIQRNLGKKTRNDLGNTAFETFSWGCPERQGQFPQRDW